MPKPLPHDDLHNAIEYIRSLQIIIKDITFELSDMYLHLERIHADYHNPQQPTGKEQPPCPPNTTHLT